MNDRFGHDMPFGAAVRHNGSVRFRLWAPSVPSVSVAIAGGPVLALEPADGGWFELTTAAATVGSLYRYILPDGLAVPDPASRFQPQDVAGPSQVVDPRAYAWAAPEWRGRPWHEAVLYELHVGTFTPEGTFRAAIGKLDHLAALGVTAVELMPLSDTPGTRNWGYDGVLHYAPDSALGTPEDLKALVDACHQRGMMAFLDVVYNHFGPEGNYLHAYAKSFFTERHHTPWGAAINYDGDDAAPVRAFMIHNAMYWLEEFRFDGLRLDAVHAIIDDRTPDVLTELAARVQAALGSDRHIHLVLENEANQAFRLDRGAGGAPLSFTAQWNDDFHHVAHILATGESGGYYADFAENLHARLARTLTEGFVYQGDPCGYRGGELRGEPSAHLPPQAFVNFLQNHDQVGNRAFGERLSVLAPERRLRALTALTLLAPAVPMLFMGEEWGEERPFLYFCDFHGELADAVREGRRREFAAFAEFADPERRDRIPDPNAMGTVLAAKLDWDKPGRDPFAARLDFVRAALDARRTGLVPRLAGMPGNGRLRWQRDAALSVAWTLGDGGTLTLVGNLGDAPVQGVAQPDGDVLFASEAGLADDLAHGHLPGWSILWTTTP